MLTIKQAYMDYAESLQGSCSSTPWEGHAEYLIEAGFITEEELLKYNEDDCIAVTDVEAPLCNNCGWFQFEEAEMHDRNYCTQCWEDDHPDEED